MSILRAGGISANRPRPARAMVDNAVQIGHNVPRGTHAAKRRNGDELRRVAPRPEQ
jgi:hypothetical protein